MSQQIVNCVLILIGTICLVAIIELRKIKNKPLLWIIRLIILIKASMAIWYHVIKLEKPGGGFKILPDNLAPSQHECIDILKNVKLMPLNQNDNSKCLIFCELTKNNELKFQKDILKNCKKLIRQNRKQLPCEKPRSKLLDLPKPQENKPDTLPQPRER